MVTNKQGHFSHFLCQCWFSCNAKKKKKRKEEEEEEEEEAIPYPFMHLSTQPLVDLFSFVVDQYFAWFFLVLYMLGVKQQQCSISVLFQSSQYVVMLFSVNCYYNLTPLDDS